MTTRPALLMALLVVLTVAGGCGGGGSGDGGMPPPGQPDNDWSVAEGVALDHPADAAPASPDSESALVGWSSDENLPATERELQQELNAWCEAVQADANDAGAQTGLIMALLAMAGQQAAPALGYNLFADYDLRDATSAAVTGKTTPEVLVQDALRAARTRQVPPLRSPAASLQPQRETVSGEDLQQWRASITGYLVPAVTDLCARAGSIADSADPAEVLISYTADGETYKLYASDFHALAGGLELIRAGLLMVTAVNPDYGDFDWDVDTEDRDLDGDGAVALADYSPNLPFSEIDAERWTQAGEAIRECVRRSQAAVSTQWLPSDPDDLVRRALAEMQDTTIAELRDYLADGLTVLSEQVDVEVEYADWDSDAGEWVNQGLEQVPLNLRELWDSPPGSFRALAPPYLYIFPNWAEYTLSDSTELLFRAHSMDGEDYSCSLWPLTSDSEQDLFPIAIKAGQHRAQFDSDEGPVDLTFSSDWREVSGTIGGTSVTGTLDEEGWVDWTFAIRWDEIPDRTISGIFPDPEQIRDLAMADYDRYVYRYGHFEVRDEPWWVE